MISDVFCKIIKGELPAEIIYQDKDFLVINDINPQAPVHLLIIPKKHYDSLEDFMESDSALLGRSLIVGHKVAHQTGIADQGYRIILNEGEYGGKLVPHLHIHLLGGKRLGPKIVK
ncbi:MAG: histidine triad nucleotide-binding protein [Parcubacteria group bacterium]|nr:histidine triad nucleotide-binding protein [Parcubacteria group bacterium]